jgi:hypothetical protein
MVSSCAIILLILFLINRQAKSRQVENSNLETLSSNHENLTNAYPSSMRFYKMSVCLKKMFISFKFFCKGDNINMVPVTGIRCDDPPSYESLK